MIDPFERREIGDTGVSVTALGLGGGPLSGMVLADGIYGGTTYVDALTIIRRAHHLGIRYFDTAPLYGSGRSERRYGAVLKDFPAASYSISTKAGRLLKPVQNSDRTSIDDDGFLTLRPIFDLSRDGILRSLEESLERLNIDSVDILYLHDPDYSDGPNGSASGVMKPEVGQGMEDEAMATAFPTMIELREQGIVKAIGCGMNQWQMPARFIRAFDLDIVLLAGRFTLLDHDAYDEFLPLCLERNVKLAIGGPYNSGILARDLDGPVTFNYDPAPPELVAHARALKAVSDRFQVQLKAAALQYVMAHPAVASVIPGAENTKELEDNIRLTSLDIPQDLWVELKDENLIPPDAITP